MKTISPDTKISELMKENPQSVEAIASLSKPLEKLKNPILRKIMASRVTIAEAANMGKVSLDDFKRVLCPLGFQFSDQEAPNSIPSHEAEPDWLKNSAADKFRIYDVRPIIDDGADPLKEILHEFKETAPGHILCVINSFIPTPLIHLLKQQKAVDAYVKNVNLNEFHTYFLKGNEENTADEAAEDSGNIHSDDFETFAAICASFETHKTREIDVRELEMPEPMHKILAELDSLPGDHALYVHHKRVPVYLLEELADKDFEIHLRNLENGEVKMLLFKK